VSEVSSLRVGRGMLDLDVTTPTLLKSRIRERVLRKALPL
jgi:hypothetical protein